MRLAGLQPKENLLNSKEKRKAPRYRGKFPVEFKQGRGVTRDFSAVGVFFETDHSFSLGEIIEFIFAIDHSDLGCSFRIRLRGCVLRVEPNEGKTGIAVAIHSSSFEGVQEPKDI